MRAYSMDLRTRVLAAVDGGAGTRAVAERFAVSASWVRRLKQRRAATGEVAPRPGGHRPPALAAVTLRLRTPPQRRRPRRQFLDAWFYPMVVGQPLPTLPLWLTEDLWVLLPLETGYEETCRILGIG